ncbi:SusC/RagA family TonB-linked outer membrane protein [Mucilaginibacter gracilis]|uniref:SusC/RagA family TonB-linked outer membrane protein n=1 Tax=Mucilaginibacter gracilis TaxID=423350 RepID=UPI0013C2B249|nr:SusC/RagA family TonB-linked outer membrane protein [Mucilaginibacter gracilis]
MANTSNAQNITIDVRNVNIKQLFKTIEKQASVSFVCDDKLLEGLPELTLKVNNTPLAQVLSQIEKQVPLRFKQAGTLIGVTAIKSEKKSATEHLTPAAKDDKLIAARDITGLVTDTTGMPINGATIKVQNSTNVTITDSNGRFKLLNVQDDAVIVVSFIGYKTEIAAIKTLSNPITVVLHTASSQLSQVAVVSTGYQSLPKERATGSFDQIDNTLLNRRVSTNIIDRIDGVASGLFVSGLANITAIATQPSGKNSGITIRGVSTFMASTQPLIVVDNFPYEGEINNLNPNDIENITILKDAAAASIWGARSGNGVIVITTKKGKLNQKMKVEFNSTLTVINKPDLFYAKNFLDPKSYIGVEQYLFNQGYFDPLISDYVYNPALSPAVGILAQQRAGNITSSDAASQLNTLSQYDVRNDYAKYIYQKAVNQQYSLGIRGGGKDMTYQLSIGQDNDRNTLVRNGYNRTTINSTNTYSVTKNLELSAGINYSQNTTLLNNSVGFGTLSGNGYPYGNVIPYDRLADANGNPLAIPYIYNDAYIKIIKSQGLMDWSYSPLNELRLGDNNTKVSDILLKAGATYKFIPQLSAQINYQNEREIIQGTNDQSQESYYTRNLINEFGSYNSSTGVTTYNFPLGGILTLSNANWYINSLRAQLNYDQDFKKSSLTAIGGAEIREFRTEAFTRVSYGYNKDFGTTVGNLNYGQFYPMNPAGSGYIPQTDGNIVGTLNRYVSYYANAAYSYDNKYTLTLSGREDGTNLFGAKTNDKITPMWSAGLGWDISKESFYILKWLPYLRFRSTYGYNGNTYQNGSAYLSAVYVTDSSTGATSLGKPTAPNPELRWEKIRNINIGIDFATGNNIISGSIELYQKKGENLIQPTFLAPQTGFTSYQANTANTKTNGIDLTIRTKNLNGPVKWTTNFLLSAFKDEVVRFDAVRTSQSIFTAGGVKGKPLEALFTYKWAGLDPTNGDPQGYLNGKISKNYSGIINNFNPDSLVYSGSLVPTVFGSFRNDFSYKSFNLSVNIIYQLGWVFRKTTTSLNYTDILGYGGQNEDFTQRWQKPGDEKTTNVPSLVYPSYSDRNTFYQYSQVLVQSGNNIRLQDIRLGYDLPVWMVRKIQASRINIFAYANNIGIIWKKNKIGVDPDAIGNGLATYPNPFALSFGLTINL